MVSLQIIGSCWPVSLMTEVGGHHCEVYGRTALPCLAKSSGWPIVEQGEVRDCICQMQLISFSVSVCPRWHCSDRKGPYTLCPVSQRSLQGCPWKSANVCLADHKPFSTSEVECRLRPFSVPLSFIAVMLWPVQVQKVSQASKHLCPAKQQTRCDVCCACQSICPFIPYDSGMPKAVDSQKSV